MNAALTWAWDTLRPDHWRHWPDWWKDWRGARRGTSRKAINARMAAVEARNRAVFAAIEVIVKESGFQAAEEALHGRKPEPERHLHLVRGGEAS